MSQHASLALKELPEKEQLFGGKFLRAVLENQRTGIETLDADKIRIIALLIESFDPAELKILLIEALSESSQKALQKHFSPTTWSLYFEHWPDGQSLPDLFIAQPAERQKAILNHLFNTDRNRFTLLKPLATAEAHYVEGIRIEHNSPSEKQLQSDVETLLDHLGDDTITIKKFTQSVSATEKQFDADQVESFYLKLIHGVKKMNIKLSNPQSFTCYLKLFSALNPAMPLFPILETALVTVLDNVLVTTAQLTEVSWQLTILDQLPQNCLKATIKRLKQFDTIREFEKRNLYGKLKGTLEQHLHDPKASNILAIWEAV